jgi:4-amino-4-deoxy-L-arabinose transferase-like glycosyltransferase
LKRGLNEFWASRNRRWRAPGLALLGITAVAVAVRLPLLGTAFEAPDTTYYLNTAHGIFHGSGYASNFRPPAYPTLIALFELLGANGASAVVVFQNLVGIALPGVVLFAGWRYFHPVVGIVGGFLAAASPLMIALEQFVLTDYLFSVVLFVATLLLVEAVLKLNADGHLPWRLLLVVGALYGLGTLLRPNGIYAVGAIPIVLLIVGPRWKPALRAAVIAVAALVVVIAPWCLHNLIRFGDPNVASEGGQSLYGRAVSYDQVPPSGDTPAARIARSVYNTADPNKSEAAVGTTVGVAHAIAVRLGQSPDAALGTMEELARESIVSHPGIYARDSLAILGRYQGIYYPRTFFGRAGHDQVSAVTEYLRVLDSSRQEPPDSALTRGPWQVAQGLTQLLFIVTIGGVLMLALPFVGDRRSRLAATTLLIFGLLGIVVVTLTARFELRHGIVFAPFVWVLAPASVAVVVKTIAGYLPARPRLRIRHAES